MENLKNNPLLCDFETGMCENPAEQPNVGNQAPDSDQGKVKMIYYTDPICSSCWGIEPQLRKLKLEYGHHLDIEYRMGGLLADWSYSSGSISGPSDVARHWDEAGKYYDMPIDGDVWLEDPLESSYPPSIAFKAAQIQGEEKAIRFLRRIKEMVFLEKKNIARWEHLDHAASETGLDPVKLNQDYKGKAKELFLEDLELGKKLGIRGFPTMIFTGDSMNQQVVYGSKPYAAMEKALLQLLPDAVKKRYETSWSYFFLKFPSLTTREFAELSGRTKQEAGEVLQQLAGENKLSELVSKNGSLWKRRLED